jgi:hypothetical protein
MSTLSGQHNEQTTPLVEYRDIAPVTGVPTAPAGFERSANWSEVGPGLSRSIPGSPISYLDFTLCVALVRPDSSNGWLVLGENL